MTDDFRDICRRTCPPDRQCLARRVLDKPGLREHPQIKIPGRLNWPALERHCEENRQGAEEK